ncbi:DNA internalization-related competence protein ComEC/Rec2 [Virgibacillus byunsanensis]|uniref:DNA internalization-related competence protein ComEC/Rec2 n=1 Tax=Virgibacillus byunsanensis TaxID=570945 RepID=A0ABW3LLI8_9BACI
MKGYWHLPTIAITFSILTVYFDSKWFLIGFVIWLLLLYLFNSIRKIPILFSLSAFFFCLHYLPELEDLEYAVKQEESPINGEIVSSITQTPEKYDFVLQDTLTSQKYLVIFFRNHPSKKEPSNQVNQLKYGATCTIYGDLEIPESSTNPGQFNYRNYLLSREITFQIVLDSLEAIKCTGSSRFDRIYTVRTQLVSFINNNMSETSAAWLNALVLGDDSYLEDSTVELFQRWNLSHILAISGLHVGLIVALIYFVLIKLNLITKEKAQWIMLTFLPFYTFLAGGEPSVWRASIMVFLFLIFNKIKVHFSITDVLSIVFILLILMDKYIIYHIGFQLSFLVTFGIILSKHWLSVNTSSFFSILQVSFLSQMIILPLQLSYFYTFNPLSILLNLIVIPYFSLFVIPFMFVMLMASPIEIITKVMDAIFVRIHDLVISVLTFIDGFLYYPWIIGTIPIMATLIYYSLFFLFMKHIQVGQLKHAFAQGFLLIILIIGMAIKPYLSPVGTVTMLDIGQGDSFIIELPYRRAVIMIDAGSTFSFNDQVPSDKVYKQIIKPYLYANGISKIDAIFVSHDDGDHIGSLPFIMEEMRVENVMFNEYYIVQDQFQTNKTKINYLSANDTLTIGDQAFYVLSPKVNKLTSNNNSLVLYTELGGKKWLFTGDIGKGVEEDLIKNYPSISIDVLKVAHHGSNTSTTKSFVEKIKPAYALLSVGRTNRYGHPTSEVIDTLKNENVSILRTDVDGAVQFYFKKEEGTFFKYLP